MAGKIINMSKVKQVLRMHAQGFSNRSIADKLGLYKGTKTFQKRYKFYFAIFPKDNFKPQKLNDQ